MGVEFFPCRICEETICDAGPYEHCGNCEAVICENCLPKQLKKYKKGTKEQREHAGDDCTKECDCCSNANRPNRIKALEEELRKEKES